MNNDFKGFAEAASVLGRTKQLADDWQEIDQFMDRRIAMLRDALGLDVGNYLPKNDEKEDEI